MNVLVIGDTHCPAMHPNYLEFLQDIRSKFKCTKIVHIGDVIDHHCVSFHDKHPDSTGAVDEYDHNTYHTRLQHQCCRRV